MTEAAGSSDSILTVQLLLHVAHDVQFKSASSAMHAITNNYISLDIN